MADTSHKPIEWMGPTKEDISVMPDPVKRDFGQALFFAQGGEKHRLAKPMPSFKAKVYEILSDHNTDTYRCVYTVMFPLAVYVLHAFQKKSTKGIKTPKPDIHLIEERLKTAKQHYERHYPD